MNQPISNNQASRTPARRRDPAALALWGSAVVLTVLLLTQIGRIMSGSPALADVVNQSGDFQMLTVDAGSDDICVVLDQRSESLVLYHATQSGLMFLGKRDLREIFFQGRQGGK